MIAKLVDDIKRKKLILTKTIDSINNSKVQRLQHHASIAVWAGNNENEAALVQNWYDTNENYEQYKSDYIALYVDTIMPAVAEQDTTRTYLVISFASFLMFYNFYLKARCLQKTTIYFYNFSQDIKSIEWCRKDEGSWLGKHRSSIIILGR